MSSNGAVALGSYEAGVLAQIYADVAALNQHSGEQVVGIDAIAGASAGAVTGALLAQAIATSASSDWLTGRLLKAWVEDLNADTLLGKTDNASHSLFDPTAFDVIAPEVLMSDDEVRSACAGREVPTVALWIALTNVGGIPYTIPVSNGEVIASLYADYEPFLIEKGIPHRAPPIESLKSDAPDTGMPLSWKEVELAVITSGAFPFAFKNRILERDLDNYPDAVRPADGSAKVKFNYTDGGVMNNNPLGRAIDAASFQEKLSGHRGPRTFLIIEPDPSTAQQAQANLAKVKNTLDPNGMPPLQLGASLINAYFNEAMYRDLATATKTNQRLQALNDTLQALALPDEEADAIRKAVGMDYKKVIEIDRIPGVARLHPLAGSFAGHFGGFFDRRYRVHDFAVGCLEARNWFKRWYPGADGLKPVLESKLAEGVSPATVDPGGFGGIDDKALGHTKDKVADRVESLVEHALKAGGLLGLLERPLLALGRHVVREELNRVMK
ncbi:patatin [Fimbriimonas ginsengisoli Gsoil 348]|uniref:Patatin n=1 Tax=Fimbriimonas ginsengisoli Gsoil 348 TaxID=661478 RepID=A0A068NJG8_FIMGI|nr:patatin [Fimbriimonas ginsengisoli Gsoil 348]